MIDEDDVIHSITSSWSTSFEIKNVLPSTMHLLMGTPVYESKLVAPRVIITIFKPVPKIIVGSMDWFHLCLWISDMRVMTRAHLAKVVAETNHRLFGDPL